jgi:putative flippase GtrA
MTNYQKLFRFCVVGIATALLQWGLLYVGVELAGTEPTITSNVAFIMVVIFNYLMHYSWTFDETAPHTTTLTRYLFMVSCGFLINAVVMYVGVNYSDVNYMLVQVLAFLMVILWNFSVALLWVFRPQ